MNRNSILRKPLGFEGRFTQFPNYWARDNRIGFRAKGLLILLMSHTDGWRISIQSLSTTLPDGITAVRSAVQELEDAGYLSRQLIRNGKAQVEASEWTLADPFDALDSLPSENLTSGNLTSGNLKSENHTLKNTNIKNTNNKEHNNKHSLDSDFELFWKSYPRRIGKGAAKVAFEKAAKKSDSATILEATNVYANSDSLPDLQFIPHPSTWLNQERWGDEVGASAGSNATQLATDLLRRGKELQDKAEGIKEIES
jgi:hypothetical protein